MIALEVSDIDVPESPTAASPAGTPSLFFRVLKLDDESLRVELWERGELHGVRRISAHGGTPELRARRIALAAAELARRLRNKRIAEARRLEAERAAAAKEPESRGFPIFGRIALEGGARGAVVGPSDLWLAGPSLGTELRFDSGPRVGLGLAWMVGGAPELAGSATPRWLELDISPAMAFDVGSLELGVGAAVAVAAVRITNVSAVDGASGSLDTWSARAGALASLEAGFSRAIRWRIAPEAGVVLRPVSAVDMDARGHRLGGLWLGAKLSLVVDPSRPSNRAQ